MPSTTLVRWLPWCMASFCSRCKLRFVSISAFCVKFKSFGDHVSLIWGSCGLHFHLIGHPKAAWDQKWSRKASRSEKCEFPEPSPPHYLLPFLMIFQPCTRIIWLFGYFICMSDFWTIFYGFWDPWKSENHAKPWEGLTKSRFGTFRKSEVPGAILLSF